MEPRVSAAVWFITVLGLIGLVAIDLVVIARRRQAVTLKSAARWIGCYIALALLFAVLLAVGYGRAAGSEFLAGYITEYSLSADNLFVFMIIIARFAVPDIAVDRVLYIGIVVSLLLRAVFIALGAAAVSRFNWVFYLFGAFLVYTAIKLLRSGDENPAEQDDGFVIRGIRRVLPTTKDYQGRQFTAVHDGRRLFTPVVLVIAAIGIANVVFALDSIPAVFGLTTSAYIVLTANAFAMMGLRQLFFLIGGLLERIVYLGIGLAAVLGFIGVKLILEALHGSQLDRIGPVQLPVIGVGTSLAVIVAVLAITAVASLAKNRSSGEANLSG